jgi:transposase
LGRERIKSASKRWQAVYEKNGIIGLCDTRVGNLGRQKERKLTLEEKNARLEAQINLLKAENELLKKIRFAERGMKK